MDTANLKIDLINKITLVKDSAVIKEIKKLLDFELGEGVFKTSAAQKKRITTARLEIKQHKVISETAANKEVEEWLGK